MAAPKKSKKVRRWRRIALWSVGGVVGLLIVGWVVLTNGAFLRSVVLPRVGPLINAELTVESIEVGLFSGVRVTGLFLKPEGGETFVEADEVAVQHDLGGLLGGTIAVKNARAIRPVVTIVGSGFGSNNLADWIRSFTSKKNPKEDGPKGADKSSGFVQLDIHDVEIVEGTMVYRQMTKSGGELELAISQMNAALDQFKNAETSRIGAELELRVSQQLAGDETVHALQMKLALETSVGFGPKLLPDSFDLSADLDVTGVEGRFVDAEGLAAGINMGGDNFRFERAEIAFTRGETDAGRVVVDGFFDLKTIAGELDLSIDQLPPVVLEMASIQSGLDIELETFSSTNHLVLAEQAAEVHAFGRSSISGLLVRMPNGTLPNASIEIEQDVKVDLKNKQAVISALKADMTSNSGNVDIHVVAPIEMKWSDGFETTDGSRLNVSSTNLFLSDWLEPFGAWPIEGIVNADLAVHTKDLGRDIQLEGRLSLQDGSFKQGSNWVDQISLRTELDLGLLEFDRLKLASASMTLGRSNIKPVSANATGELRLSTLNGTLQSDLDLPLELLSEFVSGIPDTFSDVDVSFSGDVVMRGTDDVQVTGLFGSSPVDLSAGLRDFESIQLELPLTVQLVAKQLKWAVAGARISDSNSSLLSLNTDGAIALSNLVGNVSLDLAGIDARVINSFSTNTVEEAILKSGEISVAIDGDLLTDGSQAWDVALVSTNFVLLNQKTGRPSARLAAASTFQLSTHPEAGRFGLHSLEGRLFSDGDFCGQLMASGSFELDGFNSVFDARLSEVDERALKPIAPLLIGARELQNLDLSSEIKFRYVYNEPSGLTVDLSLNNLEILDPADPALAASRDLGLRFDSEITKTRVDVREAEVRFMPTVNAPNSFQLDGWLDFANMDALNGELHLHSEGLDLESAYKIFVEKPAGAEQPMEQVTQSDGENALEELRSPNNEMRLPFDDFKVSLAIDEIYLRSLLVTNWQANVKLHTNEIDLDLCSLSLNGAPVNLNARLLSTNNFYDYAFAAEIESLDLFPLLRTFSPNWRGVATADIYASMNVAGTMRLGEDLWPTAGGNIYLGVTNAHAELVPKEWRQILSPVALLLQTPDLFRSPVKWFYKHTELVDRTLKLHQWTLMADAYIADVSANIPLQPELATTPIPDVPVHLFLSRNLLTKMKLLNKDEVANSVSYVALPDFVFIQGTFQKPKVDVDKMRTSGMVLGKAGDWVGGAASDILVGAGNITTGIGDILSGRAITGRDDSLGPVSQGVDFVFRSIGGVFGGTGDAVEKGTGVVTGTQVVEGEGMASRFKSFDWPRQFEDAPNSIQNMSASEPSRTLLRPELNLKR